MSEYDLIPDETYDGLPQDDHEKFAILVRTAQSNLARMLDQRGSNDFADEIRAQFISVISGTAEALGIEGLPPITEDMDNYRAYANYQVRLAGIVAKVRLQSNLVARPHSVELGRINRAKLKQEIDQLRRSVEESDLPQKKRDALLDKLDEFENELEKQRLSFARTMAIAASIMAIVSGATITLANGQDAAKTILTILRLVGEDKEREEAERERLSPPPKALPNYAQAKVKEPAFGFGNDLDDEVPF